MSDEIAESEADCLKFLKHVYFGREAKDRSKYDMAVSRAYYDMCRTIRFKEKKDESKELKEKSSAILAAALQKMKSGSMGQEEFDIWHKEICKKIAGPYRNEDVDFSVGQSQKWLNMSVKYLYLLGGINTLESYYHVPIDNYILDMVNDQFGVQLQPNSKGNKSWSRIESYGTYLQYQKELRKKINEPIPLRWEFENWLNAGAEINPSNL